MSVRNTIDWSKAEAAMKQAGAEVARRLADHITEEARRNAPVATGALAGSIGVEAKGGDGLHFTIYAGSDHAAYVEFGHMTAGGEWIGPNPFFRNAIANAGLGFSEIAGGIKLGG